MGSYQIPKSQSDLQITTSGWPTGMYFVRMVFMNESVAEGKVVINKR
jgi:hypothetical protein